MLTLAGCSAAGPSISPTTAPLAVTSTAIPAASPSVAAQTAVPVLPTVPPVTAATSVTAATVTLHPPTPTLPPPTGTPKPSNAVSQGSLNNVPPQDLIREMALYVGAGGETPACSGDYSAPEFLSSPENRENMEIMPISACGWQEGEQVKLVVAYPDGSQHEFGPVKAAKDEKIGDTAFAARFNFRAFPRDPAGTYTFTLQGASASLQGQADIRNPQGPRLYRLNDRDYKTYVGNSTKVAHLLFWNFKPGEKVRLLVFKNTQAADGGQQYQWAGWQQFTITSKSALLVAVDFAKVSTKPYWQQPPDYIFAALGEQSGEVHETFQGLTGQYVDAFEQFHLACAGAKTPRIQFSAGRTTQARAVPGNGKSLDLYTEAGQASGVTNSVPDGTEMQVLGPGNCADGLWWWQVQPPQGSSGWAPETLDGSYVLEPVK